jgi:hypothetical protein
MTRASHTATATDSSASTIPARAAFYCVSDERYFPGAVAMINSLRLLGHAEPIYVVDCGLHADQRELLAGEAKILAAKDDSPPVLQKTHAPLRHPAEVAILIDADLIVTRSLEGLIDRASTGKVLAVDDGQDRFFPEWGKLTGGTAHRRPYVSSCLTLLGGPVGRRVVETMDGAQRRADIGRTPYSGSAPDFVSYADSYERNPYYFADQDVLNAVLVTDVDPDDVDVLDRRDVAILPFDGLRVVAPEALHCVYEDGSEPYAVHHLMLEKPWLRRTGENTVYTQLLRRLLSGNDLALRVPSAWIPSWLRPGPLGSASRKLTTAGQGLRWRVYEPLRTRLRPRQANVPTRSG